MVEKLPDLAVDFRDFRRHRFLLHLGDFDALIPHIAEHIFNDREQLARGRERFEKVFECALDLVARNRLCRAHAAPCAADIIGVIASGPALRPVGGERLIAVRTAYRAPEREVGVDVLARRYARLASEAVLNGLEGLEADEALMLRLAQRHAPRGHFEIACIQRLGQNVGDTLRPDSAVARGRKRRTGFKKAFHLGLCAEALAGIAFKRFFHDWGQQIVEDQNFATARHEFVAIADRRMEYPIAVHGPRPHPVCRLFGILLALVLRHRGHQVFMEDAIGVIAELHRRAFEVSARLAHKVAQIPMSANVAGKTADVVDDHGMGIFAVRFEEGQHVFHGGAVDKAPGYVILEHLHDFIAAIAGIFAATRFLTGETIAARGLLGVRDAAINDGDFAGMALHESYSFPPHDGAS